LILVALVKSEQSPEVLLLAGICLVLLPLCGATGLAFVPAMAVVLGLAGWSRLSCSASGRRWTGWGLIVGAVLALVLVGVYFVGYRAGAMPARPGIGASVQTAMEFLSCCLGQPEPQHWQWWAAVTLAFTFLGIAVVGHALLARSCERWRALALLVFLLSVAGLSAGIAWGRSGFGPGIGLSARYVTLASLLPCCLYFIFMLYCHGAMGRWLQGALLLSAACMLWPNARVAKIYVQAWHDWKIAGFLKDLHDGLPSFMLADRYSRYPLALALPAHKEQMAASMEILRRAGVGSFSDLRELPYHVEIVGENVSYRVGPAAYVLKTPEFVYALRVHYRFRAARAVGEPPAPLGELQIDWKTKSAKAAEFTRSEPLVVEPGDKSVLVWINGMLSEFAVSVQARGCVGEVSAVELLLPTSEARAQL
jgi:hypothetical protein